MARKLHNLRALFSLANSSNLEFRLRLAVSLLLHHRGYILYAFFRSATGPDCRLF